MELSSKHECSHASVLNIHYILQIKKKKKKHDLEMTLIAQVIALFHDLCPQ